MRILVTGASGFVGSLLVPRLLAGGHEVTAFGRDAARVRSALGPADVRVVQGDALSGRGVQEALKDAEVAYYLIHSMESARATVDFASRERLCAQNFAAAAARAGVRRIVYLGGLLPAPQEGAQGPRSTSRHLASRHAVEEILLDGVEDSLALRASIVIGARSRSFRLLVRLVERMPLLALPAWQRYRTQPIDQRDVIEILARAADLRTPSRSLDIGGPDVLTYGEMMSVIAERMLVGRPAIRLRFNLTPVTARVAAAIAGEDPELVLPLMEGLTGDLVCADDRAAHITGVHLHTFPSAVDHALAEWERTESLAARSAS